MHIAPHDRVHRRLQFEHVGALGLLRIHQHQSDLLSHDIAEAHHALSIEASTEEVLRLSWVFD
jgi:stress-induced morphogen